MALDRQISDAWIRAADDLAIRVIAPCTILAEGETREFEALVVDFGSSEGAVVMSEASEQKLNRWFSILYPNYRQYDRVQFTDILNDWGWFGNGTPPNWYTGRGHTS
jgi:hypothetical protein